MLLAGIYRFRSGVDPAIALKRFLAWTPPAGYTINSHWSRADGMGGILIVESDSTATLLEASAPYSDVLDIEFIPLIDITEAVPILQSALSWRESVS
jgi:hypothetical protein